jgi:MoaA/NifB/PqqE/SkfB family radical SAM enzyme
MCSIWLKQKGAPEPNIKKIKELLTSPLISNSIQTLIITGGEPTLRDDVADIIRLSISSLVALKKIALISNGLNTERTVKSVRRIIPLIPQGILLNIGVSLDGIGATHDRVRGVEGAFEKTIGTLRAIKELIAEKKNLTVSVGMTISRLNICDARAVYEFAREENVRSSFTTANVVDVYLDNAERAEGFAFGDDDRIEAAEFFEWLNERAPDPYNEMVARMLRGGERSRGCAARDSAMTVDVDGSVYPCGQTREACLGNIYRQGIEEIWEGRMARHVRAKVLPAHCKRCMTNCYPETA